MKRAVIFLTLLLLAILVSCGEKAPELSRADHVYALTALENEPEQLSGRVAYDGGTLKLSENRLLFIKDGNSTELYEDVTKLFDLPVRRVNSIAVEDGRIYLCADSAVAVADGSDIVSGSVSGSDAKLLMSDNGVIVFRLDAKHHAKVSRVTPDAKLGENIALPKESVFERADIFIAPGHDLYLSTNDGLYACDGGEAVLLCDYINSDIDYLSIRSLSVESEERFYLACIENGERRYFCCDRLDDSEVPEKYLIRIAGSGASSELRTAVLNFNRSNDTYRATLSDYSRFNTYDDPTRGSTKLRYDIVAGNIPDIMVFTSDDERFGYKKNYIKSKMFTDLYKYIDSDPDISRGDLLDSATVNNEHGGKLFELISRVNVQTMTAKGKSGGYTLSSLLDEIETSPDQPFGGSGGYLLYQLMSLAMKDFVTDRGCDFDKPEFRRLLSFMKSYKGSEEHTYSFIYLNRADEFKSYAAKLSPEEFTGLPTSSGNGAMLSICESFAISEKSPVRDGAWELIKTLLLGERTGFGFPTLKSALREEISAEVGKRYAVSSGGGMSGLKDGQEPPFDKRLFVFTEEYCEKLFEMLDGAQIGYEYLSPEVSILLEEASAYFAGAKELDETIRLINDRMSTYISEGE